MGLQIGGGLDDVLGADHPAHAPAGHGVRFGHAVEQNQVLVQLGSGLGNGGELHAVVGQVLVDLITDHKDALGRGPFAHGLGFLGGVHRTRRVGRRAEQQRLGLLGVGGFELLRGDLVVLIRTGEDLHGIAAGQPDGLRVGGPVRGGQQDVVALVHHGLECLVDRLLAPIGDQYLCGVHAPPGIAGGGIRNGPAQLGEARSGAVPEVLGVFEGLRRGLDNVVGGREVGLAGPETDHGPPLGLECLGLGVHRECRGLGNRGDLAGNSLLSWGHGGQLSSVR